MEKILVVAFITEAIWETIKMAKNPKGINLDNIGAMILGIVIAIAADLDIFAAAGIKLNVSYVGNILTGLLISRGSNFVHDILGSIGGVYQNIKTSAK